MHRFELKGEVYAPQGYPKERFMHPRDTLRRGYSPVSS